MTRECFFCYSYCINGTSSIACVGVFHISEFSFTFASSDGKSVWNNLSIKLCMLVQIVFVHSYHIFLLHCCTQLKCNANTNANLRWISKFTFRAAVNSTFATIIKKEKTQVKRSYNNLTILLNVLYALSRYFKRRNILQAK